MARLNYDWQTINAILARAASGGAIDDAIDAIDYLYKATYGTTTVSQITAAVNAGKIPVCVYNQVPYLYAGTSTESSTTYYIFSAAKVGATTSSATINTVYVSGTATWGNTSFNVAPTDSPTFTGSAKFTGNLQVLQRPGGDDTQYAANTAWVQDEFDTHYVTAGRKSGTTLGGKATAEGRNTTASGVYSHAEGSNTVASGNNSHAEGVNTTASGNNSHAEGSNGTASGQTSHAEGANVAASGVYSHAEGVATTASGTSSHAEGSGTKASANSSHAEGYITESNGTYSHAEGSNTIATHSCQHVFGSFNIEDPSSELGSNKGTYVEIVGNGTADDARSNARTLDWEGNEVLSGKLTISADPVDDMDVVPKKMLDAVSITDTASGSIASFSDGADGIPMRSVKASIEPMQDLHGCENPWPEGGGKNKLPMTLDGIKAYNTSGTWSGNAYTLNGVTFTVQTDNGGNVIGITTSGAATGAAAFYLFTPQALGIDDSTSVILSGCASGGSWGGGANTYALRAVRNDFNAAYNDAGNGVTFTYLSTFTRFYIEVASGVNMSSKTFYPMIRLSTEADATFAPYSNICPIDGWTGAEVTRTGKNLLDPERLAVGGFDNEGNIVISVSNRAQFGKLSLPTDGGDVTVSIDAPYQMGHLFIYDAKQQYLGWVNVPAWMSGSYTFRTPSGTRYIATSFRNSDDSNIDITQVRAAHPQIELSSAPTDYEPFAGQTFPVTWESQAGEVFGGYFVVNSDGSVDLTADRAYLTVSSATFVGSNVTRGSVAIQGWVANDAKPTANNNDVGNIISNMCIPSSANSQYANVSGYETSVAIINTGRVSLRVDGINTLDGLKNWVDSCDPALVVCYELAAPTTYHLDSIGQITTLLGNNNIWSNTGDTEVEYVADPKLYIQKVIGNSVNDGN